MKISAGTGAIVSGVGIIAILAVKLQTITPLPTVMDLQR